MTKLKLSILGCRGIPAKYGGFENFAERLALYLTSKGWLVTVYCQPEEDSQEIREEYWNGIRIINVPVPIVGAIGSIIFDWKSTLHVAQEDGLILVLGYNTALFSFWCRLKGKTNLINMDGIEWRRAKWKLPEKAWLYLNEWAGCWLGNHLIADHPQITTHLRSRVPASKITMIPYGTEPVKQADVTLLQAYHLLPNQYALVVARTEPENHLLEIVSAFSRQKRGFKLVVLGRYLPERFSYHQQVLDTASDKVQFLGTIYDQSIVQALRFYARLYIHGHSVGGTNPSLVESLAASCPILAHDNRFNRWVAGTGAHYFQDESDCAQKLKQLLNNPKELALMKQASWKRYQEDFSGQKDLKAYEDLLTKYAKLRY
jgi:glycosyltransferase involved in cell wall biosynthesis